MKAIKNQYALTAGSSIIIMAIAAGFAYGYVHNLLFAGSAAEYTVEHLAGNRSLLLDEILAWVIVFICDLLATWSLYHYFKQVNMNISLITAILRLIYTMILAWAIMHLINILPLLARTTDSASIPLTEITDQVKQFEEIWYGGLIIFGVHLLGLGYLSSISQFIPRLWTILLVFAGFGYIGIHLGKVTLPGHDLIEKAEMILSLPMAMAEIGLAFWLIFRGSRIQVNPIK